MNRREFLATAAASASLAGGASGGESSPPKPFRLRQDTQRRTMYFNDARHLYLYAFEPPMSMEDAWRPIDELAGTAVNTFIYGVETEGLFSDTKVGHRFGAHGQPFEAAHSWRAWYNMQSLIDRGMDPLRVLIDRAHERGLDFITSMRMGGGPRDPRYRIGVSGPNAGDDEAIENNHDFAHQEVREARYKWLEELASYPVEGIEIDWAFTPYYFKPREIKVNTTVMTDYMRQISNMIRSKAEGQIVGARVFPHIDMNLALGLDVATWLSERLVDYVAPLYYGHFALDADLPFESLVSTAHPAGAEVYPILQPYWLEHEKHATPAMLRAAAANYWAKGADGLIVAPWFYWPFRDAEKAFLTEIGDPRDIRDKDKHYVVGQRIEDAARLGYDHPLPLNLPRAGTEGRGEIPFYVADDLNSERVGRVRLCIRVDNLVTADQLAVTLNGKPLTVERLRRTSHRYEFQWLEYELKTLRPRTGPNMLTVALESRPEGFAGGVVVDQVELLVEYGLPQSAYIRPDLL